MCVFLDSNETAKLGSVCAGRFSAGQTKVEHARTLYRTSHPLGYGVTKTRRYQADCDAVYASSNSQRNLRAPSSLAFSILGGPRYPTTYLQGRLANSNYPASPANSALYFACRSVYCSWPNRGMKRPDLILARCFIALTRQEFRAPERLIAQTARPGFCNSRSNTIHPRTLSSLTPTQPTFDPLVHHRCEASDTLFFLQ